MSIRNRFHRLFPRDNGEVESFLRREEKYVHRCRLDTKRDRGPDADRLRYEILRSGM